MLLNEILRWYHETNYARVIANEAVGGYIRKFHMRVDLTIVLKGS